jgi:3-oxoacyl-[acyl-carrier protein] reductase
VRALLDLTGRVAIVTGAAGGIGAGIAARLAEAGAGVLVHFHRNRDGARRLADDIAARGRAALACEADLTDASRVEGVLDAAAALGEPDILVNNAGTYPLSSIAGMAEAEWDLVVNANLKSVHLMTQAFCRRLIASGRRGAIVNIASIEASNVAPAHAHYQAAKAGVVMYTRAAAREFGVGGIRVNAVSPGLIWREGLDAAWPEGVERYTRAAALGRLGRADDVADACLFLVSPAARWITGIDLVVDGGVLTGTAY